VKDERERIGCDIFVYLREALLDDVTEYGLHDPSFAELRGG